MLCLHISLCTVPDDFHAVLHNYTRRGFRVIALAWKALDEKVNWHQAQRISRSVRRDVLNVPPQFHIIADLISESFHEKVNLPSIHYDMFACLYKCVI